MSDWTTQLRQRLASLSLRPEREAEIVEELSQHLDEQVRERVTAGMSAADAKREALADLDAPGELARRIGETEATAPLRLPPPGVPSRASWLQQFAQDVRLALRGLRRRPWFSISVLVTMMLTIGPTTAIVSVGNWLLWTPSAAVTEPNRLAVIWSGTWRESRGMSPGSISYANLDDLRTMSQTLSGLSGWQESNASVAVPGAHPKKVGAGFVSADFFDVLGVRMAAGRTFNRDDDQLPFGRPVVIASYGLAVNAFGSAEGAIEKSIHVNGRPVTIVGVAPRSFLGLSPTSDVAVWYTGAGYSYLNHYDEETARELSNRNRGLFYMFVGRLAANRPAAEVQAELDTLLPLLAERHPSDNGKFKTVRARVFPGLGPSELSRDSLRRKMQELLAIAGLLLLLGCANVSNLLLAEAARTQGERTVRLALGASRNRLVRQMLTGSVTLTVLGATAGIGLAFWFRQLVQVVMMPEVRFMPDMPNVPMDRLVLGVTVAAAVVCGILAGLLPAWFGSRASLRQGLTLGNGRTSTGGARLRGVLAAVQLSLSLALVVGAVLLVTSTRELMAIDLGFEPDRVTLQAVSTRGHGYTPERTTEYVRALSEAVSADTDVEALTVASGYPFGYTWIERVQKPGGTEKDTIDVRRVTADAAYSDVLGLKLLHGRYFRPEEVFQDTPSSGGPVVVSESLARMMFGRADVLGERVTVPRTLGEPTRDFVIVGVMHDTVVNGLTASREPLAYFPIPREGLPLGNYLLVKSRRDDHQVGELVASVAVDLDPTLPLAPARPLLSEAEYELATSRTYAEVLTLLGGIGLLLAAVGMYGLLAQAVGERRREFGVRLAIGAASRHIAALVFQQAAWIAALGVAGGVVLAWWGTELIITYLWGVTATDPRVYALTVAVLLAAVTLAAARPAWQATRVSPIETLRAE